MAIKVASPSQPACRYCGLFPSIQNSHVVPRFIVQYIRQNSVVPYLLDSFKREKQYDGIKGSYLCQKCDNETFSVWEGFFANKIFRKAMGSEDAWGEPSAIRFCLSICFRYACHYIEQGIPKKVNPVAVRFRDLSHSALNHIDMVGKDIHIYPYLYAPITSGCALIPGVNHVLSLLYHSGPLDAESGEPQAFLSFLPGLMLLFTDGALHTGCPLESPQELLQGKAKGIAGWNRDMPTVFSSFINRMVGDTQANQKTSKHFTENDAKVDKKVNAGKVVFRAQLNDGKLREWQKLHARRGAKKRQSPKR